MGRLDDARDTIAQLRGITPVVLPSIMPYLRVARDARIAERKAAKLANEAREAAALAAAQTAEAAAREVALKAEQEARDGIR